MIEQTALEAIADVLRLEHELEAALCLVSGLMMMVESQRERLEWLDDVRQAAQMRTWAAEEEASILREELVRFTRAAMS